LRTGPAQTQAIVYLRRALWRHHALLGTGVQSVIYATVKILRSHALEETRSLFGCGFARHLPTVNGSRVFSKSEQRSTAT